MTHRIAYLKPGRHVYTRTEVSLDRSMTEIKKMLLQAGCTRLGMQDDLRGQIPLYTLAFEKDGQPFMIEFPIIYERMRGRSDKLRMDISGRIIRDRIKVLLMEVEIGASPFTAAMAQFVAIADRSTGRPVPMENYMLEHQKEIPAGTLFLTGGNQ
jgi:hypothetical protein